MVPKLRFRAFSKEYNIRKLKEIADIVTGNTPSTSNSKFYGGEYMFVSPVDINEEKFVSHTKTTVSKEGFINGREIPAYSIMFVCIGSTIGKLAINSHPCITNQQINSLICNAYFSANYLYYILEKHSKKIKELAGIQAVPLINKTTFSNVELYFPNTKEQTKVAGFISSVDEKITLLNKQYDLLCQYKKGMMQKIFSQEVRFKDENGETFPEWIQTSLGTISKVYDGTHQTPNYVEFGVPFYSVEHVTADNFDDTKYISDDVFEQESKRVSIQQGDILMTRIGDIGTVKHINWIPRASFYVSLSLIKVRKSFDSKMISYCMQSDFFQKDLHKKTIHVAFPKKINLGEISNCKIKMPASKKEQTKIVILLSAIDDKIAVKKAELDKLKTWKQGLLQQMFV